MKKELKKVLVHHSDQRGYCRQGVFPAGKYTLRY